VEPEPVEREVVAVAGVELPAGVSSPRMAPGTHSSFTPARQLSKIWFSLTKLWLPPAMKTPVPTGTGKAGQTVPEP
jgi:hypothetical protein